MPILLQLAQSYSNPDSVNYKIAYLRERIGDEDFGKLAFEDQVQLAMLGETIIVGGYLRTELIAAKSIRAEKLDVEDLAAISGKFTGDVYVGGDLLVGGQGVLSVFQYISTGDALNADGWSNLGGYEIGGTVFFGHCRLTVPVPERFIITKATLTVEAMARYTYDEITQKGYWSQSKNLKIYKASGDRGYHYYPIPSGDSLVGWDDISDITNDVWGVSAWSPPLVPANPSPGNIPYIQRRSESVKDYLTAGQSTTFMVEANVADPGSGVGRMIVVVEGYVRPEGLE